MARGSKVNATIHIKRLQATAMVDFAAAYIDVGGYTEENPLTANEKNAVLYSLLYAQLAANRRLGPMDDVTDWYKLYRAFLQQCAWAIPMTSFQSPPIVQGKDVTDHISPSFAQKDNSFTAIDKLLKALRDSTNSVAGNLMCQNSMMGNSRINKGINDGKHATFQLASVAKDEINDELVVELGVYHLITKEDLQVAKGILPVNDPLTYVFKDGEEKFQYNNVFAVINMDLWNNVKGTILDLIAEQLAPQIQQVILPEAKPNISTRKIQ